MSPETLAIGNLHQQTDWEGKSSKRTRHFQTDCSSGQEIALIDFLHIQIQKESCCFSPVRMMTCEFLRQSCLSRLSSRHGTRKRLNQQLQLFFVDGRTLLLRPGTMESIERQWMVHFVCPPLSPCFFKAQLWWVCLPLWALSSWFCPLGVPFSVPESKESVLEQEARGPSTEARRSRSYLSMSRTRAASTWFEHVRATQLRRVIRAEAMPSSRRSRRAIFCQNSAKHCLGSQAKRTLHGCLPK